jgi:GNAT superfamily N-acetyltransferase
LIWNWQFEENPYELPFEPIVIKQGEKIVGFNGAMNVGIIYDGKCMDAMWSCDFYVHSDFRGKGLGKIVKDNQFNSNSVIMALGLSETAVYVWKKKGCEPNENICALRKYRKVDSFKKLFWVSLQMLEYIKGLPTRIYSKAYQYTINDALVKKPDVDELWEKIGNSYNKIVVRNYNYLHWRYEKHPLASYQFIHVFRNTELIAIGIFRRYKNSTKFVDMVAHSKDTKARLALITGWLKSHSGSKIYSCISTDKLLQKCLLAHGFHKKHDKQWFFVHSMIQNDVHPEKNWFIMPGDSDGEFLEAAAAGFE